MCKDPEETEFIMAGKAWQLTPEAGCFIGGQEAERDKSKWGQALGLQRPPPVMYFLQQTYTYFLKVPRPPKSHKLGPSVHTHEPTGGHLKFKTQH